MCTMTPILRQLCSAVAVHFASFSAGAAMGYPSVLLYQLKKKDSAITLDLDTASWIGSIHGLAGLPSIVTPAVMQWKGRKFTFMAACLIIIIGWTLAYSANGIAMILLSESFHGFGANILIAVSYDYLSEIITPVYRNAVVQSYGIINAFGIAVAGIMTKLLDWRDFSIIMCIPAVIAILISLTWLESPLWLAYRGDLKKCETTFTKIRGTDDFSIKELEALLVTQKDILNRKKATKTNMLKRFRQQITSRDFILPAIHIFVLLNHAYWSGAIVILLYSVELITRSSQNETAAFIGSIMINLILVTGITISSILIRYYKNKPVLLISTCAATACLSCTSLVTYLQNVGTLPKESLLCLYCLIGYMVTNSLGQVSVVFTMSAELMPVKYRGIGGALFVIYTCSLHLSSLKVSPYLFDYTGLSGTFLIYALNSIVCGLIIWKYVPETKGRTLQEIEHFYMYGSFEIKLLSKDKSELIAIEDTNN